MRKRDKAKRKGNIRIKVKMLLLVLVSIYVVYILVEQEIMLRTYNNQIRYYDQKIEREKDRTKQIERLKDMYNTEMYIEQIARDRLGLVKPGEKIFIDISK